ncbi:MAG: low temperature requirement protein A, partial [Actinomycetales bacterium]
MTTSETAGREGEKQRVGWFELFYDLVLVATINRAAQVFGDSPTWSTGSLIAGGLAVILVLWLATTVNLGSFAQRSGIRQVLVVVQMVAIVIAALATGQSDGLPTVTGFIA